MDLIEAVADASFVGDQEGFGQTGRRWPWLGRRYGIERGRGERPWCREQLGRCWVLGGCQAEVWRLVAATAYASNALRMSRNAALGDRARCDRLLVSEYDRSFVRSRCRFIVYSGIMTAVILARGHVHLVRVPCCMIYPSSMSLSMYNLSNAPDSERPCRRIIRYTTYSLLIILDRPSKLTRKPIQHLQPPRHLAHHLIRNVGNREPAQCHQLSPPLLQRRDSPNPPIFNQWTRLFLQRPPLQASTFRYEETPGQRNNATPFREDLADAFRRDRRFSGLDVWMPYVAEESALGAH